MSNHYKNELLGERSHYLRQTTIDEHLQDLIDIYNNICFLLAEYPNFDGLDFCDVSAGGIQIRLFHKEVIGYCYASITVDYDFANKEEVICAAIDTWKEGDNEKSLSSYQHFLDFGNKYGWD